MAATRDDQNDRALRVNLAIASGKWDELVDFSTSEWNKRYERTAEELLMTAQLAQAVNAPHAKEMVRAAAERAAEDPNIFMGAYMQATSGGWEREPIVGGWLQMARMRKLLQIPAETVWLHESMRSVIRTIKGLWRIGADLDEAAIRAEWLLGLVDIRGWAPSAVPGNERDFALFAHAAHLQSLMSPSDNAPDDVRDAYFDWIDRRLLHKTRDGEPEVFAWIVDHARELIRNAADATVRQLTPYA